MVEKPRKLTLKYSRLVDFRLAEIWRWNADRYGVSHADDYVDFLKQRTQLLATEYQRGRSVPGSLSYRYVTIKKRARGHGYVVVYKILEDEVHILFYFHTAQDWMKQLDELMPPEWNTQTGQV